MTPVFGGILGVHHVHIAIPAGSIERVLHFYRDLLGLEERPVPPRLAHLAAAWLESGPVRVHIGVDLEFHAAKKAHPAFLVRSLDPLVQRLEAAGFATTTAMPIDGFRRGHVFDPVGNRVELIESVAGNPHAPSPPPAFVAP